MRRRSIGARAVAAMLGCGLISGSLLQAQTGGNLSLPPNYGAGANSAMIQFEADYIRAQLGHPTAKWVKNYFEAREINRADHRAQNPEFLERAEHQQRQAERRVVDNTQLVVDGDLTAELNWLLRELASVPEMYELSPYNDSLADSPQDLKLVAGDAHHLRLTDGGRKNGALLAFRADAAEAGDPAETRWPRALRGEQFDAARDEFEAAWDDCVGLLRQGERIDRDHEQRLMQATDRLCDVLNEVYPRERRAETSAGFVNYAAGKRFLQSLAAAVYRLIETNDSRLFDGSYRFEGDSVVDLVRHLCKFGLEFAPPEPGDEGTYKKVFFGMRGLYIELVRQKRPAEDYARPDESTLKPDHGPPLKRDEDP